MKHALTSNLEVHCQAVIRFSITVQVFAVKILRHLSKLVPGLGNI